MHQTLSAVQPALQWFAAEGETARIGISTSESEVGLLSREWVGRSLRGWEKIIALSGRVQVSQGLEGKWSECSPDSFI